jgi:hypothetical protein
MKLYSRAPFMYLPGVEMNKAVWLRSSEEKTS